MKHYFTSLVLSLFCFLQTAIANENSLFNVYLSSREGDPSSLVENVSTIHGDYTDFEVDVTVAAPDSLNLSRFYSSRDTLEIANFGGWRFNPHCFLSVQKDPKGKSYTTTEGKFEYTYVYLGNPDGAILTYVGWQNTTNPSKKILFKIDPEGEVGGIANTAKGNISCWTNLKNNELYFDPQTNSFELTLCSEGKRFYSKHNSGIYILTQEILPSGNKVFYEFDDKGQVSYIKETNASEKKVLAWIKITYGNSIHIETSEGKLVDYHFKQDASGIRLLTEVFRSHKPNLTYQYQVVDSQALLARKILPEGRFVQIDYYKNGEQKNKVQSVITPVTKEILKTVLFSYGNHHTTVEGPGDRKEIYRFDHHDQLIAIEQFLNGSLYRTHRKIWGTKSDSGYLIATSVEDSDGNIFYHKYFTYDKAKGNIIEEREYGDIIGLGSSSLHVDENGLVTNQDGHIKNYSYFSGKETHGFFQTDAKGTGVKYWYKKGTNLLLKKFILTQGSPNSEEEDYRSGIKERHFYEYNDDASLVKVIVDNGTAGTFKDNTGVSERTITYITPKQELPNIGAPELIEQKYRSKDGKSEVLLEKTINTFDEQGNITSQAVYDANENICYTLFKKYKTGLLVFETDALNNETHYSYDANQNLVSESYSATGISIHHEYDFQNRLFHSMEIDKDGNQFNTQIALDPSGNKSSEVDRFGNVTTYLYDSLGRLIQITYPEINDGIQTFKPIYTYSYDLFDHPISITDSKGRIITQTNNVLGKPIEVNHLNGSKEIFKYDSSGNLHHHYGVDGILQVFSYDYKGRLNKLEYFKHDSKNTTYPFKEKTWSYSAFHKTSEKDARGKQTNFTYESSGRLSAIHKEDQKVDLIYDSLGRIHGIKKWKSPKTFTFEIKEYDLLDRVVEERTEDENCKVLLKKRYIYNEAGQLAQIIGYPQNNETPLFEYDYDSLGRLVRLRNAENQTTTIAYDDTKFNEWGQRIHKRTLIDPTGNQTEEILDVEERLTQLTKKDKSGKIIANSNFYYDSSGNQISQKNIVLYADNPSVSYETEWSLNDADQIVSYTLGKGILERKTRFEYNSYGDISAQYHPGSQEPISYRYNAEGNLETISYKKDKKEINYKISYDRHKNISEINLSPSCTISYSFNAHDLPLTEKIKDEFGSYQVDRTYDGEGKIQKLQLPDGSIIEYFYEGPFVKEVKRFSKDKNEIYHYQVSIRDLMGNILEEILPGQLGNRKQFWNEAGHKIAIITDFFQDKILRNEYGNIKKRQTIFENEDSTTDYDYNFLEQLILEKGKIEHSYAYDSIGNRLKKDNSTYKVDGLNQLVETEDAVYTFDLNGNLATKTVGSRTWEYQSNHLNQIVSIKDPEENFVKFTYDPFGKRLTKIVENKGKKTKIFRFFFLGDTEIGCIDEKGVISELKIPGNPNNPEDISIAIEIGKEIYVPLYDLLGNIICLLDHQRRKVVETYRYSVYGEEKVFDETGNIVLNSSVGNPWRYRGKRIDKETGLLYFGYRYYDPEIGRWITPDPAGSVDGPNLYAYAHNNPLKFVDYFGLNSTLDENCGCTQHGHPGWHNAPEGCVCICGKNGLPYSAGSYRSKIGSNMRSAIAGVSHGIVDFTVSSLHDLQAAATYIGAEVLELSVHERHRIIEDIEQSQGYQMAGLEEWMMGMLSIDKTDTVFHSFRSKTTLGLEVGSLITGGYGVVKGAIGISKLARMPIQTAKLIERKIARNIGKSNKIWTNTKQRSSVQNAYLHWKDHKADFPEFFNAKQYVESAKSFINKPPPGTLIKMRANGDFIFYNPSTNTFVISNADALPKTMFKPCVSRHPYSTNLEYFNAQK